MRAVYIREFGGVENLELREQADPPKPKGTEIIVKVRAAGLNRADIMQRLGRYPPPPGYSPNVPGLEFAGHIFEVGQNVNKFKPGERVFGITAGEAQAEFLTSHESVLSKIPENNSSNPPSARSDAARHCHAKAPFRCDRGQFP